VQDPPMAVELLKTIEGLLDDQVLPVATGPLRHASRVAANLCRIVGRELELGAAQEERAVELLRRLLEEVADASASSDLTTELAAKLAAGAALDFERRAQDVVLEIVQGKLAIAKPGYDDSDCREELES